MWHHWRIKLFQTYYPYRYLHLELSKSCIVNWRQAKLRHQVKITARQGSASCFESSVSWNEYQESEWWFKSEIGKKFGRKLS